MSRVFAIIPAAGHSRRMGQPKLLLPWQDGQIIDSVLSAWTTSQVEHVVVVTRRSDTDLQAACARWPVVVTWPETDPTDMKASIQHGIRWLQENLSPPPSDGLNDETGDSMVGTDHWMVAPADLPTLRPSVIDRIIAARHPHRVVVPCFGTHESHPVLLPWSSVDALSSLQPHEGLKTLIQRRTKLRVNFAQTEYAKDIDTPAEYQRIRKAPNS